MELLSDYKEAKVFELQEDSDISEKFSLGNLLRSSKSSPVKQKIPAMHFPWEKREKHTAKTTDQPKLWHTFGEVSFHLRTTEYFETESIQPMLCYSERNSNIPGPPCKLFLFSTALLPPLISHTLLKNDSLWFAVLFFQPENVLLLCKCFLAVILCRRFSSYFWRPGSAFGHTICFSMVTSEKINPFIKKAWPGSNYCLALDSYIPLISQLWRNY